jgi:aspartate/methionine/tyrosine aminotransferase
VSLGVMSKAFGMPGARIGWIATSDQTLRKRIAALRDYTTICSSAPSEVLALIGLRARERVLDRAHEILSANLRLLDDFFTENDRFTWVRPRAGSVCFPEKLDGPIDRFAADLAERTGVLVLPSSQFGYAGDHFRLGFGRRDMPVALELMAEFAASWTS